MRWNFPTSGYQRGEPEFNSDRLLNTPPSSGFRRPLCPGLFECGSPQATAAPRRGSAEGKAAAQPPSPFGRRRWAGAAGLSFYPPWGGGRPKLHLHPTGQSASPTAAASNKTPGQCSWSPAGRFRASPGNRGWGRGRGWGRDPASYAAVAGGRSSRLCQHPGLRWRTGVSLRSCPRVSSLGVSSCLPTEKPTTSLALFLIRKTRFSSIGKLPLFPSLLALNEV